MTNKLPTTPQLFQLSYSSDDSLTFTLQDVETGVVNHVTVKADMVALPAEALLFVSVDDEATDLGPPPDNDELSEGPTGCLDDDSELSRALRQISPERLNEILREELDTAPDATWRITPRGEEIDLRDIAGGLF